jgi:hypothetical protein
MSELRPVSVEMQDLVRAIIQRQSPEVRMLISKQLEIAAFVETIPGRMVSFSLPPGVEAAKLPDGPVRPIPFVADEHGRPTSELVLVVHSGCIDWIEQPWWSDEAPRRWPDASELRFDS